VHGLLAGERVTLEGRFWSASDAVLLPAPAAPVPLLVGSNGPRVLAATLPHVDAWNTWYEDYGNTPEGFARLNERISAAASEAGRAPGDVERSACVLVRAGDAPRERPEAPEAPALTGPPERVARALGELADAGADEAILVVDPIDERSIRELGEVVARV
jgi:alkanesulfonate monooxygenase SsuD/methylene tetrahydromethanopterin reductase-like flavin-dependent oxidoreductase (luciferase family)